jgi:hypothetical protein
MQKQLNLETLQKVFQGYPKIQAVYLFGSTATGMLHQESDMDLAVFIDEGVASHLKLDLLADLARSGFCDVDLVLINTEDIVLKYEAVRLNRLVYKRDDFDRGAVYSKIVRQYLDFYPYLAAQRAAYKKRILNGTTRGHT